MKALTAPLTELGSFQQILEGIAKGNTPVFATGVIDAAKTHLAYSLQAEIKRPLFLLTYSELRAKEILEDLTFLRRTAHIILRRISFSTARMCIAWK